MSALPTVRPGQIWADNDKRSAGRQVKVVRVDDDFAYVIPAAARSDRPGSGRTTRIRIARMRPTSTGYRLVSEPDGGDPR